MGSTRLKKKAMVCLWLKRWTALFGVIQVRSNVELFEKTTYIWKFKYYNLQPNKKHKTMVPNYENMLIIGNTQSGYLSFWFTKKSFHSSSVTVDKDPSTNFDLYLSNDIIANFISCYFSTNKRKKTWGKGLYKEELWSMIFSVLSLLAVICYY